MSFYDDKNYRIKVNDEDHCKSVDELKDFLNKIYDGRHVVFIYNKEDDQYYKIDNCRIDSENDVVLDISLSWCEEYCGVNDI